MKKLILLSAVTLLSACSMQPKVVISEKVIYVDKPIVTEKVIYVDKAVLTEKIVYVNKQAALDPSVSVDGDLTFVEFNDDINMKSVNAIINLLQKAHDDTPDNTIILPMSSRGGDILAGIQLGTYLATREYISVVVDAGQGCYSACAYAYLGAWHKNLIRSNGKTGELGVHTSSDKDGNSDVKGSDNYALQLSYLSFVFQNQALANDVMTLTYNTPPSDIFLFTDSKDLSKLNIKVIDLK